MKKFIKRTLVALLILVSIGGTLVAIEYFGGHSMGLFAGSRPEGLGFTNGKFKTPSWKPNTVSSTVEKSDDKHFIEPITFVGDADATWKKLQGIVKAQSGAAMVDTKSDYLYAEFKTPGMGFVDDVEFALVADKSGANLIHVRSGSRLGVRDFGVNRKRIESIRSLLTK
jgi:uncharacterized protein (DUF1499 family)